MADNFNIQAIVSQMRKNYGKLDPQQQAGSLFNRPTAFPDVDESFVPQAVVPKVKPKTYPEAETFGLGPDYFKQPEQTINYTRPPLKEYKPQSFLETAASAVVPSAEASFSDDSSFVMNIWGPYYQTDNSVSKNARALMSLQEDWSIPDSEKQAQELAAKVFEGDSGYSYNDILDFIGKIGQVESGYKVKEQQNDKLEKGNKAWSYYQVEPTTALDLLTNSTALFGPKFEEAFKNYSMKGVSARENLANRSKEAMADLLLKDSKLAAALATAKVIATTKK